MTRDEKWVLAGFSLAILLAALMAWVSLAHARDLGQWANVDPEVRQWYQALMQPDVPAAKRARMTIAFGTRPS